MKAVAKKTKSAKVDVAKLARVRRYLGARSDSDAISQAIDIVDEQRMSRALIKKHGGSISADELLPRE